MDIMERLNACLRFDAPTPMESELEAAARDAIGEIARLRAQAQHESDCAEAYKTEADRLRDENESLRGSLEEWRLDLNSLRDENATLRAERDDADRRAGAAEREQEHDREAAYARDSWLRRAKEQWGVGPAISFDVVWGEALELKKDAERLDWLERETHKSSYAVQFRILRDPEINAGMNRIECTTTVGSGPWQRDVEGATLRAAIDAAMQKGE